MNHTDTDTGGAVYDTVEAIRSWPVNDGGWHVDPKTERWVRLGNGVTLGNWVTLPLVRIAGYTANPYTPGVIRIGCEIHTVEEWRQNGAEIMARHDIDPDLEPVMMKQLEWLAGWFDAYPDAMLKAREAGE